MKGICNLTGKTYIIEPRNLKELAQYFIEKYNLSVEDIASFYRERTANYRYDGFSAAIPELDFNRELKEEDRAKATFIKEKTSFRESMFDQYDIMIKFAKPLFERPLELQIEDIKNAHAAGTKLYRFLGQEKYQDEVECDMRLGTSYNKYYQELTLDEAIEYFKEVQHKVLLSLNDTVESTNNLKYECDFSPIVCNLNVNVLSENGIGDIQLIDGFKRLFTNSLDRLDFVAPVKTYIHLSDEEYIRVLNACNGWKFGTPRFYDRGYVFSLQNRFGINLKEFNNNQYHLDLVSALTIYGQVFKFYDENKYLVQDVEIMKQLLSVPTPIEPRIEIMRKSMYSFINWLSRTRVVGIEDINYVEFWKDVLEKSTKVLKKKTNASGGWADNFVRDNIRPLFRTYIEEHYPDKYNIIYK